MNIVLLATRIYGTDGVSLECVNWQKMLTSMGHRVHLVAGKLDRAGTVIPDLYFQSPKVVRLHDKVVYGKNHLQEVEAEIFEQAGKIEGELRNFFNNSGVPDLLITSNTLSIPVHFPLAVALTRVISELNIKTIARHHDFWWERDRFLKSEMFPFFQRWFPPTIPQIKHVVINSIAQKELKKRTGIEASIIYDTLDFEETKKLDTFSKNFRSDFGIATDDIVFLQATRIVPRKRIELAIALVEKLNNPKVVLVIAGYAGDEAGEYERFLKKKAKESSARVKFIGKQVNTRRKVFNIYNNGDAPKKRRIYTLWDCYLNCDFITYPTKLEGFGNQFVEAVKFKKPIIVSPYEVFKKDILPMGFDVVLLKDKIDEELIKEVKELINNPRRQKQMVEKNFRLGEKYLSFRWAEEKIKSIFETLN